MFRLKKERQITQPEMPSETQRHQQVEAPARPAPLTYAQAAKMANAGFLWLKGRLKGMAADSDRAHDELGRGHAEILRLLSEVKDGISRLAHPPCLPEVSGAPTPNETTVPATEPDEEEPRPDIINSLGMSLNQYEEFLQHLMDMSVACPQDCFARTFAQETISRLEGMRADLVSLLKMNDVELIDSVAHFDPSRHMPLATCPRPEGATGDGEVKRVGLLQKHDGRARVIRPASIVLYDDVKVQIEERR